MILAAGRGERMRPLTDTTPKPLLAINGKPLIVHQIEALARAGFDEIVINISWLGEQIKAALGNGQTWNTQIIYSEENPALETAGGIARALPLLKKGAMLIVSADVYSAFDYQTLLPRMKLLDEQAQPRAHLVMVPNPTYYPQGDFALENDGSLSLAEDAPRLTFGNIGIYHTELFADIDPNAPQKLTPYYRQWIKQGFIFGEFFDGFWRNVGTPEDLQKYKATPM